MKSEQHTRKPRPPKPREKLPHSNLGLEENIDPQRNGAGCYIIVPDVDAWHARITNAGLNATVVETRPWGMREFTTIDPSGNRIRIGTNA